MGSFINPTSPSPWWPTFKRPFLAQFITTIDTNNPIINIDPFGLQTTFRPGPYRTPIPEWMRENPYHVPGDNQGPSARRAPGGSGNAGNIPEFVGKTYLELYIYTLNQYGINGAARFQDITDQLVQSEAMKYNCNSVNPYLLCFKCSKAGPDPRYLIKVGEPRLDTYPCVSIDVEGRKGCPCINNLIKE